jgi:hypothetical protein
MISFYTLAQLGAAQPGTMSSPGDLNGVPVSAPEVPGRWPRNGADQGSGVFLFCSLGIDHSSNNILDIIIYNVRIML